MMLSEWAWRLCYDSGLETAEYILVLVLGEYGVEFILIEYLSRM